MAVENVTDVAVPETTVDVPAHVERPQVKYNPAYAIKVDDNVDIIIQLNGNEIKHWKYNPNNATFPAAGKKLNLVCGLRIVETTDTDAE